jgi:methyl-accepting chemotaxis protein
MSESTPPALQGRSLTPLLLRLFFTRELVTLLSLPMAVYVDVLLLDLDRTHDWHAVAGSLALTYLCSGVLLSLLVMNRLLRGALRIVPDEPPGRRLERLLALPWKLILLSNVLMWMLGGFIINTSIAVMLGKDPWSIVPQGMAVATGVGLLNGTLLFILYERMLMPLTLEEFERNPRSLPASGSLFRPRQSWFLPYVLASLLFGTLVFTGTVVNIQLTRLKEDLREELVTSGNTKLAEQLAHRSGAFSNELLRSVSGTTALLLLGSALTVWWMGRRQRAGAMAIYQSLEGLTRGSLRPPRWVSTDEMGDLSSSVWLLFDRLQELPRELQTVTRRLEEASSRLGESSGLQHQTLERQSIALRETDTTAREIRQNSLRAQSQVRSILSVFNRTAELGRQGETAIQHSLQWLSSIGTTTENVRSHVSQLTQHTRELQRVIETVEELAKRSNLLAINAAIQAVHSGQTGMGFTTVAREFRALANRSVTSTHQVRTILDRLGAAIHDAIYAVDTGAQGISEAVKRLNTSSTTLRELALLAQRNSTTVEEITHAVEQQHQDIAQLFKAFQELLHLTNETLTHLQVVQRAAGDCDEVSAQVDALARRYGLEKAPVLR